MQSLIILVKNVATVELSGANGLCSQSRRVNGETIAYTLLCNTEKLGSCLGTAGHRGRDLGEGNPGRIWMKCEREGKRTGHMCHITAVCSQGKQNFLSSWRLPGSEWCRVLLGRTQALPGD